MSNPMMGFEDIQDPQARHFQSIQPQTTGSQSVGAAFDLAQDETITGALTRMVVSHQTEQFAKENNAQKLDVEELNKRYPGLPQPFTEPTDPYMAGEIARRQTERMNLTQKASLGPQGGIYAAGRFGAGLAAHALDPFETGAAIVTGGAAEAALGATTVGRTVGFGVAAKTLPQVFGTGVVEGVAANAAIEGMNQYANHSLTGDNTPYSVKEGFKNALIGGLVFGGLKTAGVGLMRRLNPKQVEFAQNAAAGRLLNDKVPNVEPLLKDFATEQAGIVNSDYAPKSPYAFEKITDPNGRKFYTPKETAEVLHTDGESPMIGANLGEDGLYLTDNPSVANGIAGAKTLDVPGSVHTLELDGARIKSLGLNPNPELVEAAKAEGFDGVHYEVNKTGDLEHEPYNAVKVFDPQNPKLKQTEVALANDDAIPRPSAKEVDGIARDTLSHQSDLFHDEPSFKSFSEFVEAQAPDLKTSDIELQAKDLESQLREQLKQHPETPEAQSALDSFKEVDQLSREKEKLIKGTIYCLTRGA